MKKTIIYLVLTAIAFGSGGFYTGRKYQQTQPPTRRGDQVLGERRLGPGGSSNDRNRPGGRVFGDFTAGEVIDKDDKSITLKLRDGGSKLIFLSEKTAITKSVAGGEDDLKKGAQITVSGSANSDGSITAEMVQVR